MSEDHEYCGECIFCTSVCPECKSTNIRVKYTASFEYENDTKDMINLNSTDGEVEIECFACGEWFEGTNRRDDKRLNKLWKALDVVIDLPHEVNATVDGEEINILRQRF